MWEMWRDWNNKASTVGMCWVKENMGALQHMEIELCTTIKEWKWIQRSFLVDDSEHICKVKFKILQEFIKIKIPSRWSSDKIENMSRDILRIEAHNKAINQ